MWCILLYLRAVFVATPTGEVSEVEIFLRFDGVPEPALSSVFRTIFSLGGVNLPYLAMLTFSR